MESVSRKQQRQRRIHRAFIMTAYALRGDHAYYFTIRPDKLTPQKDDDIPLSGRQRISVQTRKYWMSFCHEELPLFSGIRHFSTASYLNPAEVCSDLNLPAIEASVFTDMYLRLTNDVEDPNKEVVL